MSDKLKGTEELNLAGGQEDGQEPSIADLMRKVIEGIGEDPTREGLRRTPERFEHALRYLTSGYHQDPEKVLNGAVFTTCYDQMVVVNIFTRLI